MKNQWLFILLVSFLSSFSLMQGQVHYLEFSKEGKKSLFIETGKRISFVLKYNNEWEKGELAKITSDSLFIKQKKLTERMGIGENPYDTNAYSLDSFRILAYPKTSRIIGTSAVGVLYFVAAMYGGFFPLPENEKEPSAQLYEKEIDFEEGWSVKIIKYEK
jgi:hypothetical protein